MTFIQNLILSWLIFEIIKLFFDHNLKKVFIVTAILLSLLTSLGWYSNQVMPDIFTGIMFLSIINLLFKEDWSKEKYKIGGFIIVIVLAVLFHFSNLLMLIGTMLIFVLFRGFFNVHKKVFSCLLFSFLIGLISSLLINFTLEKKVVYSKGSHVFLMAHLNDTGILKKYLEEYCIDKNYSICDNKEDLPGRLSEFIFESDIIEKSGGWYDSKEEFNQIIKQTLIKPKYLFLNIQKSLSYTFTQFFNFRLGDGLSHYNKDSEPVCSAIKSKFSYDSKSFLNSKQNLWNGFELKFDQINFYQNTVLFVAFIFLVINFGKDKKLDRLTLFVLLFLLLNAMSTAGITAVTPRFQSRVIWLIVLPFLISVFKEKSMR